MLRTHRMVAETIDLAERNEPVQCLSPELAQMLQDDPRLGQLSDEELLALNACIGGGGEIPGLDLASLACHEVA